MQWSCCSRGWLTCMEANFWLNEIKNYVLCVLPWIHQEKCNIYGYSLWHACVTNSLILANGQQWVDLFSANLSIMSIWWLVSMSESSYNAQPNPKLFYLDTTLVSRDGKILGFIWIDGKEEHEIIIWIVYLFFILLNIFFSLIYFIYVVSVYLLFLLL